MKPYWTALILGALLSVTACSRDAEEFADATDDYPKTVEVTLDGDVSWANTGIRLSSRQRIRIEPAADILVDALGRPEADFRAPVPTAGSFALIARFGEDGLPVAVGESLELQAPSDKWGEWLFIGRNGHPNDFATPQTSDATEDVTSITKTVLKPLKVYIQLDETDAPALQSPVNGFFTSNVSPTFDWDDVENAFKYVFELSRFPDFRDQVIALELSTGSNVSLANFRADDSTGTPSIPGQNTPAATLTEGVYYWRVRSQTNVGRTIAPVLDWTDHSPVGWFGIETKVALPDPRILAPIEASRFSSGNVLIEFVQPPDASGNFWRYRGFTGACGTTLDTVNSQVASVSPWYVFLEDYQSNFIGEIPQRYGAASLSGLATGEYLYEIEVIDGADGRALNTVRAGRAQVSFSVGCQN